MFWGLLWGVGISTPSPHPLTAGRCPTGRLNQRGRGRGDPLPAGLCSCPEPWPPAGRSAPFGFQSSFSPVLPLFLSPTVFCHQFSDGEKKTAQSPTSPSHKYACAFPEPFSAPFSPPTPTPHRGSLSLAFFLRCPLVLSVWLFSEADPETGSGCKWLAWEVQGCCRWVAETRKNR